MNIEDNCDKTNEVQIGTVFLSVVDKDTSPRIKVEIRMFSSYSLKDVGIYVGWTNPVSGGDLNQILENYIIDEAPYIYYKEVGSMVGDMPLSDNPPFFIIVKTTL